MQDNVSSPVEVGVVVSGVLINVVFFLFLMLVAFCSNKFLGRFPAACYRFISAFGFLCSIDPILTLLVDLIWWETMHGDAFKLGTWFERREGDGLIGHVITVFLNLALMAMILFIYYIYLVSLHMNGRLLDVYNRITGELAAFFIPFDAEISGERENGGHSRHSGGCRHVWLVSALQSVSFGGYV